jgi:hypothetical protein
LLSLVAALEVAPFQRRELHIIEAVAVVEVIVLLVMYQF